MENEMFNNLFDHNKSRVARALVWFLITLTVFFAMKLINEIKKSSYIGQEFGVQNIITVEGEGEVIAIPDTGTFSFSVNSKENSVIEAQENTTKNMNSLLNFLEEKGVSENDVKTTSYNIFPRYEYVRINCVSYPCPSGEQKLVGYEVTHTVRVKVRNIENAGELLSGIGEKGATNVGGLTFSVDEPEKFEEEARSLAVEDAREKAKNLAKDLGVKLGKVVSFNELGSPGEFKSYRELEVEYAFSEEAPTPEIPIGESQIISRVNITYEIR